MMLKKFLFGIIALVSVALFFVFGVLQLRFSVLAALFTALVYCLVLLFLRFDTIPEDIFLHARVQFKSLWQYKQIVQRTTFFALILFLIFVASCELSIHQQSTALLSKTKYISNEISNKPNSFLSTAQQIALIPAISGELSNHSYSSLIDECKKLASTYQLSYFVITDNLGTVLVRVQNTAKIGDNLFTEVTATKPVYAGNNFSGIIQDFDRAPAMVAGTPIRRDNSVIGTIFVGRMLDSTAIAELVQNNTTTLLTADNNLVGHEFRDITIPPHLQEMTLAVNESKQPREVIKLDNCWYIVAQSGIDNSLSKLNVITLSQLNNLGLVILRNMLIITLFIAALVVILLLFRQRKQLQQYVKTKPLLCWQKLYGSFLPHISKITVVAITVLIGSYAVMLISLEYIHHPILAGIHRSEIRMETSKKPEIQGKLRSNFIAQDDITHLEISFIGNNITSDALEFSLLFSPDHIVIKQVLTDSTKCTSFSSNIDNENGRLDFSCALIGQPHGMMVDVVVQAQAAGIGSITFDQNYTYAMLNGTPIETAISPGDIKNNLLILNEKGSIISPIPIISLDHPNSNQWYQNKKVTLNWLSLPGQATNYCLGKSKSSCDNPITTNENSASLDVNDGIWYFGILPKEAKDVVPCDFFSIKIDSTPPDELKPLIGSDTIEFALHDEISGIKTAYLTIDGGQRLLVDKNPFPIPNLLAGKHLIKADAEDNAGNVREYNFSINKQSEN